MQFDWVFESRLYLKIFENCALLKCGGQVGGHGELTLSGLPVARIGPKRLNNKIIMNHSCTALFSSENYY